MPQAGWPDPVAGLRDSCEFPGRSETGWCFGYREATGPGESTMLKHDLEAQRERLIAAAYRQDHVSEALRVFHRVQEMVPPPAPATRVAGVKYSTVSG